MDVLMVLKFVSVPPSQRSVTKNWPHSLAVSLTHCCACFLVPTKRTLPPLRTVCGQKVARGFELRERLAEVNDVNAVARVEDERLHLGIPTLRLVSEMDARFQQFFYADAYHNFPLVETPHALPKHPAEHGIEFDVIVAAPRSHERGNSRPFSPPPNLAKGTDIIPNLSRVATVILSLAGRKMRGWARSWTGLSDFGGQPKRGDPDREELRQTPVSSCVTGLH